MITSYHIHTTFSDGRCTVREMIQGALKAGVDEIGFSDHFVLVKSMPTPDWSMDAARIPEYIETVREAASEFEGRIVLRCGLEADFVPETVDELAEVLRSYPFDYVIGGIHILDGFMVDECAENWDRLTQPERDDMMLLYWDRIEQLAKSGLYDFVAHLDVYKKFGHIATIDLRPAIGRALDAIAKAGMAVEVNTAGWYWDVNEAYPSPAIIAECHKRGIPMLVNADAHNAGDIIRSFESGYRLLRDAGYTEKAVFAGRKMSLVPL